MTNALRLAVLALVLSAPALAQNGGQLQPSDRAWRSPEGFQAARWGMTKAEVRKLFKGAAPLEGNKLFLETKIASFPSGVVFLFVADRLVVVQVNVDCGKTEVERESCKRGLLKVLTEKYGPGQEHETILRDKFHEWATEATRLQLADSQFSIKPLVQIRYSSVDLKDLSESIPASAKDEL